VNASDFRPVEGGVQRPKDPLGFFEFAPREGLDPVCCLSCRSFGREDRQSQHAAVLESRNA